VTLLCYGLGTLQICARMVSAMERRPGALRSLLNGRIHAVEKGMKMATRENNTIVESAVEARAGVTGHNVRYVLLVSIALVVVLFVAVYLYNFV
jgi:hypothetical protein